MLFETPLQSRERKYRETVSLVLKGIAFFMLLRFTIYFAASVLLLLMKRGVLPEVPYDVLNSLTMLFFSLVGLTLPFFFVAKDAGLTRKQVFRFRKSACGNDLLFFFAGLGVCLGLNIFVGLLTQLLRAAGVPVSLPAVQSSEYTAVNIIILICSALLAGLLEELSMRGVLLPPLQKYGGWFAVLLVGILFGSMHTNFMQALFAAAVGTMFGFIAAKTHSILLPVLIHISNNFIVESSILHIPGLPLPLENTMRGMINLSLVAAGIVCLIVLMAKDSHFFRLEPAEEPLPLGIRVRGIFGSPFFWAFLAMLFITWWML